MLRSRTHSSSGIQQAIRPREEAETFVVLRFGFWSGNVELLEQKQDWVALESRLAFLRHDSSSQTLETTMPELDWHHQTDEGQTYSTEFLTIKQQCSSHNLMQTDI